MQPDQKKCISGKLKSLGICLCASTILLVQVEQDQTSLRTQHPEYLPYLSSDAGRSNNLYKLQVV